MADVTRMEIFRIARFLAGGALNTAIGGGAILTLQAAGLDPHLANAGGYAIGIPCGYLVNRLFVFERHDHAGGRAASYLGAVAIAFIANQLVLSALTAVHGKDWRPVLAQFAALATYTATLFVLCRLWVFADVRSSTSAGAQNVAGAARAEPTA